MTAKRPLFRLVETEVNIDQRQRERDLNLFGFEPGTNRGDMIAFACFLLVAALFLVTVIFVSVTDAVSR
jgi:hypothetical protein